MLSMLIPNFDLNQIYESGIPIGWKKVDENWYIMHTTGLACAVKQYGDKKVFYCSEEEFFNTWYYYFTIDVDYVPVHRQLRQMNDNKLLTVTEKRKGMRLIRDNVNEVIIRGIINEHCYDSSPVSVYDSMLAHVGIPQKDTIQNMGRFNWKNMPPIMTLQEIPVSEMYSSMFDSEPAQELIEISKRANECKNLMPSLIEALNKNQFKDANDIMWILGLSEDVIKQVLLYCGCDFSSCPETLIDDPVALIHKVSPISYLEWYGDELEGICGMFGAMLRCGFNMGDVSDKLTDMMGYQLKKMQKKRKMRNPWERRKIEGEETWG